MSTYSYADEIRDLKAQVVALANERDRLQQDLAQGVAAFHAVQAQRDDLARENLQLIVKAQALEAAASWQDIATVPKDGTRVLTWDGFLCGTGRVHFDPCHPDGYFVQDGGGRATHWIRPPAPPAAARREEES